MVSVKAYYNETVETVRRDLNGEQDFLTNEEVKRRQEKFGFNELAEGKKKSGLQIFLEQYKDFLVLILIVSAVVSLFLGETESAAVILVVITMNAILGTVQTIKAENSLESLKQLAAPEAKVVRNGAVVRIPGRESIWRLETIFRRTDVCWKVPALRLMKVHLPEKALV